MNNKYLTNLKIAIEVLTKERTNIINTAINQLEKNLSDDARKKYNKLDEIREQIHQDMLKIVLDNYE